MRDVEKRRTYMRDWQRQFRAENPEYYRRQYKKHRAKLIICSQNWYKANLVGDFDKKLRCLLYKARQRAKKSGLEFSISADDFKKVTHCPLLGIELCFTNPRNNKSNSPSIDRIDPTKGYIPGNVWIISARANQLKNDASVEEIAMILRNLKRQIAKSEKP